MLGFSAGALAALATAAVAAVAGHPFQTDTTCPPTKLYPSPTTLQPTLLDFFEPPTPENEETFWGDDIHTDPADLHRVYFQNVDGIRNDADEIDLYVETMHQFNVGTICWADPSLDFQQPYCQSKIRKPVQQHFQSARMAFSSSTVLCERDSAYKPGGTLTATTDKWTSRSTGKPLVDPSGLGRWSGISFLGKQKKRLSIITAYRSPRQQLKSGFGFYDQQYALLLASGLAKPNVRTQFIRNIIKFIQALQKDDHEIILSLDANETNGQDKVGIDRVLQECQLSDLHTIGPDDNPPATYPYGNHRRIDYMLGTPMVKETVRRAGYLAYNDGIHSKHRGLFLDFDFQALMGQVDTITSHANRRLKSEDPVSTDKYLEVLKEYVAEHNVRERLDALLLVAHTMPPTSRQANYDAIDRDVTRAMLSAEKAAKRPSGKYVWSPKLREHGLLTRFWRLRLRELESGRTFRYQRKSLQARLDSFHILTKDDDSTDLPTIKTRWKAQLKLLRQVRKEAFDHRVIHLESLLQQYKADLAAGNSTDKEAHAARKDKVKRVKRIINTEGMRKPYRIIKNVMKPAPSGGLSKLFVPVSAKMPKIAARFCDPDGSLSKDQLIAMAKFDKKSVNYETILESDVMEQELHDYNRKWFRQAHDTPFGNGELFDVVGFEGLTEQADAIINGECISHMGIPMNRELQVFLEECKRPSKVSEISAFISLGDFKKCVKRWKETTSTSPSGRHLGHYKTSILDDEVAQLHVDMINFPITYGFAPERWTRSVSPLIEKDEGMPLLTRLRVIHLFEADYNLFLKIIYGRRMVKNGERNDAMNDQQHGARPRRMTIDALLLSRFEKDLIRQLKINSAHMDNDATGCYDRIIVSLGMIACRRLGMPSSAIRTQAEALRLMRYAIKHAYGVSEDEYKGTMLEPLFGTGQGSGSSPAIWLGLVVILLNAFDRLAVEENITGFEFEDPWNEIAAAWHVGAFVDDTNQGVTDSKGNQSKDELVESLRQAGQMWENLLHISGGALNLSKCLWSLQYWEWDKGRPRLQQMSKDDPLLVMTSGSNPDHNIIRQVDNDEAPKGLGVFMNFKGTFGVQTKKMRLKFDTMAQQLRTVKMSPILARKYYFTMYLPAVKYSLPVTSMTMKELHSIQSLMTSVTLNKFGYNRNYPRAVAFAPIRLFGCGMCDLRIEQGLAQITAILDYIGTGHKIGDVMLISLRSLQVEAGISSDILAVPSKELPYVTDCWFLGLRKFCAKHRIRLHIKANRVPSSARIHDQFIMNIATSMKFKRQELVDINLVRIYLKVCTISDIATAVGGSIHLSAWKVEPFSDRRSNLSFPRQEKPTSSQRGLWRKVLRHILCSQPSITNLRLKQPLGLWSAPSNMVWESYIWDGNLYRQNIIEPSFNYERYVSVHRPEALSKTKLKTIFDAKPSTHSATVPRLAVPADVRGTHVYTAKFKSLRYPAIQPSPKTFKEWCGQLPPAEERLLHFITYKCDEEKLLKYLQLACTIYIGTDGGKREQGGSFSWIICSPDRETMVVNAGPVDGWRRCQSSLRSEATAISSVCLYLDELASFHSIEIRCKFRTFIDSTSAITNAVSIRDMIPKRKYPNNADCMTTIKDATRVIRRMQLEHVKSHQDNKTNFKTLPFEAQLNTICDRNATRHLDYHRDGTWAAQSDPLPTRNMPVQVFYGNTTITSHYVSRIRAEIGADTHRDYLQAKYNWSDQQWCHIAWDSFEMVARRTQTKQSVNRSKLVHNWLNLGSQRAKFVNDDDEESAHAKQCPYCKQEENFQHMLTCSHRSALKTRYDATETLRKALKSNAAGTYIMKAIKCWIQDPSKPPTVKIDTLSAQTEVHRAIETQTEIGWLHMFRGFVSIYWGHVHMDDEIVLKPATNSHATLDPIQEASKNMHVYMSQVRKAIKSRKSPDSRRASATAYVKTVIQALQDYSLTIWEGRNNVLHGPDHETDQTVHAQLNADIRRLYKLKDDFADSAKQYFHLPLEQLLRRPARRRQRWLNLARLVAARASGIGTGQQMLSTYYPYTPSSHQVRTTLPPTLATPIHLQQSQITRSFFLLPTIPEEPP